MGKKKNIYNLPATHSTPEIVIDYDNKVIKMSGRCILEDPHTFFFELLQKIVFIDDLKYIIELEYLNSSSLRHLFSIIRSELTLKEVEWIYDEEDFDMGEKGNYFKEMVNDKHPDVIFNLIEKPR